jgi:ATP-binding cassette subfamily B protein
MNSINLAVGQYHKWPSQSKIVKRGEVTLVAEMHGIGSSNLQRHSILTFKKGEVIPGLDKFNSKLSFVFKAITAANLTDYSLEDKNTNNENQWDLLILKLSEENQDISVNQISSPDSTKYSTSTEFLNQVNSLLFQKMDEQKRRLTTFEEINANSERKLFLSFESTVDENSYLKETFDVPSTKTNQHDYLNICLEFIANQLERPLKYSANTSDKPRINLIASLEKSGFIYREVLLTESSLDKDCGHLIGFIEDNEHMPIVLYSENNEYQVWQPGVMNKPLPISKSMDILKEINPRVISILPGFLTTDLTTLGLLRYSYGKPSQTQNYIIAGVLAGLIIGFLLSIGKDVGAARWIFGMGGTGLMIGATLGILSSGFRTAVGVMLLSTFLGLLTPTFNTIIANQALPDKDLGLLLQVSGILVVSGIAIVLMEWTKSKSLLIAQQKGAVRSQFASMHRMLSLSTDFYRKYSFGDLQLRFSAIDELRDEIKDLLEGGLLKAVLTSVYVLFMLKISVKLTCLAIVIALMLMIPTAIVGLQSRPLFRKQEEVEGEAQTRNLEIISSVAKLRLAGAEMSAARWWGLSFKRITTIEMALDAKEAVSKLLQSIIPNLGQLLLYIVITKLASEALQNPSLNSPNVGQLLGFFTAFGTFIGAMASLAGLIVGAFDLPIIYERARPILEAKPEAVDDLNEPSDLKGGISIDRVSYRYESNLPLTLDKVSIDVKPGEFVALVGPSGSGKSTVIRMMLGFGDPEEGTIRFDGQPLSGLRKDRVRRQIGTVMQNSTVFAGSLFECIAGGSLITLEDAWFAAEQVAIADEIRELPMGMQTVIPEGGSTLSGGQRQRLCIARALVRQPNILIFDEATSALDNRTQRLVTESLEAMSITRIAVAHRLSTVRHADKIYVLDSGQIRQTGNFEELIQQEGLFADLMKRQIA